MSQLPVLFTPIDLRSVQLKNRLVVSPMCQYSAGQGIANEWHLVHYGRFALGGFGAVILEATSVARDGQITHGDLGIWNDAQATALAHIAGFLRANGSVPGIQLAHAGRKASSQRPWEGDGPLGEKDIQRGDAPWPTISPSAEAHAPGWHTPRALEEADLEAMLDTWEAATKRALKAGFEIIEVHCAHGYLLHEFLSPLANSRNDEYGGSLENRMRFPLRVIERVRKTMPDDLPMFVRISAVDAMPGGWSQDDSVVFAAKAKALGADVIDCSTGGLRGYEGASFPGYQVPHTQRIKEETGILGMAVGLITDARHAETLVSANQTDLVALGREALFDPQWPNHARRELGQEVLDYSNWPIQSGHWLTGREKQLGHK
ncbi:NADH:flavin oxidoreductase/NADH oxidase [Pseudomonas tolaasii]|uniref:NADH:flavin oxidoreductase/NADH oxidase n=1 Tax=Pseudomonas tolaasii TaxID=29442 RepID=UPI001C5D3BF6|nr:NADH:flavin oxidoreductase/NADH oxidase [Pseudomonas tolaasii]MBW4793239.1 NADH:flavin oxidoreductase/NADH oxidase [Pseudomonas tolaasii]